MKRVLLNHSEQTCFCLKGTNCETNFSVTTRETIMASFHDAHSHRPVQPHVVGGQDRRAIHGHGHGFIRGTTLGHAPSKPNEYLQAK